MGANNLTSLDIGLAMKSIEETYSLLANLRNGVHSENHFEQMKAVFAVNSIHRYIQDNLLDDVLELQEKHRI